MIEKFSRSWALVKASAAVLRSDKELLLFPALSALCSLLVLASFATPLFLSGVLDHAARHESESELAARIESFELAYRMQSAAPEAINLDDEPEHIHKLYGIGEERCDHFARQCLTARRLVERGVRFVQIYSGGMENERSWDGHVDIFGNHTQFAGETEKPVAGLLTDLAQRGLLDDTLVIWQSEFGRMPISQRGLGRDHNPGAMSIWMAGAKIRGGQTIGESDEFGYKVADQPVNVHDLHATILHLLGMDHTKLTYMFQGRPMRLTDVFGNVIPQIAKS